MSGFSDYTSQGSLNWVTGQQAMPALGNRFLALFTTAPTSDAGTGGTEVSGGAYARVQVAGAATVNGATLTSSPTLHFASTPAWVVPGMNVFNATTGLPIGTVLTNTGGGTTMTLVANAANAVGATDSLVFSAWPAATAGGASASSVVNGGAVSYPAATASWGTVVAWGIYDALTGTTNLINWDYLGAFVWKPCSISLASPGVFTVPAHGYAAGDSVLYSIEYGGVSPATLVAGATIQTVSASSLATDTFNVAVNATTNSGNGMVRKVTQQSIPSGVTASFAAGTITLTSA